MMPVFCSAHRLKAQHGQPKIALTILWRNLIEQLALPADVVVDVHNADHDVQDPDHKVDDPISLAGSFATKAIGNSPGNHAD